MLHEAHNRWQRVGKALALALALALVLERRCFGRALFAETDNIITYVWDIFAKPCWARQFNQNQHGNLRNTQI